MRIKPKVKFGEPYTPCFPKKPIHIKIRVEQAHGWVMDGENTILKYQFKVAVDFDKEWKKIGEHIKALFLEDEKKAKERRISE